MVQIFDSWGANITPTDYDIFSAPYIKQMVDSVKETHPDLPIILYISGSGGLIERMADTGVDIVSVDHSVSMTDAISRIGAVRDDNFGVQVRNPPGSIDSTHTHTQSPSLHCGHRYSALFFTDSAGGFFYVQLVVLESSIHLGSPFFFQADSVPCCGTGAVSGQSGPMRAVQ